MLSAIARRAGRRGAFLAFLAVLDMAYGYSLWVTAAPQRFLNLLLPWQAWGIIWIACGVIVATGVFARWDRFQFTVAAALKGCWALLYVKLWLADSLPRGWVAVTVWGAFALVILVVAGWPEPIRMPDPETPPPLSLLS